VNELLSESYTAILRALYIVLVSLSILILHHKADGIENFRNSTRLRYSLDQFDLDTLGHR